MDGSTVSNIYGSAGDLDLVEDGQTVVFAHGLFRLHSEGFFRIAGDEPVFVIQMDEHQLQLPFKGLRREFKISETSRDGVMLERIVEALAFVTAIRAGDRFPEEVLSGEASWRVTDRQRLIARDRLRIQLVSWHLGAEVVVTNDEALAQVANDPAMKGKLAEAEAAAAEVMGIGSDGIFDVEHGLKHLSDDLAYIEWLRDRFGVAKQVCARAISFKDIFGEDRNMREVMAAVERLVGQAVRDFDHRFELADAQTGEVLSMLKNPENVRTYIRQARDDLYRRLSAWTQISKTWKTIEVRRNARSEVFLEQFYQFLAPRYMEVDEWVLFSKRLQDMASDEAVDWGVTIRPN